MGQLDDPFLTQRLNPLFFQAVRQFWEAVASAQGVDPEQIKMTQFNLLQFIFRHLFTPLYYQRPPEIEGSVFFLALIHTDGIGDYFSLLKCAKILKERHPKLDVQIAYTHQQKLPEIDPKDYLLTPKRIHPFLELPDAPVFEPVLKGEKGGPSEMRKEAESVYALMKKSLAIVNIALALNTFDNPALAAKSFYFSETGNFQGIGNYLQRNWMSMGLLPFEEGIYQQRTFPLEDPWRDRKLQKLLISPERALYLGYLSKIPEQLLVFIYLACLKEKSNARDIDIIIPKYIRENPLQFDEEWLAAQGIGKMALWTGENEQVLLKTKLKQGKTVRFVPCLPVAAPDFEKIIEACDSLVGCTGDGSLSDCLIAGKVPFYELRKHKQETWQAFQELARHLSLKGVLEYFSELEKFRDLPPRESAEKLHAILEKKTFGEWQKLLKFVQQFYSFEESLLGHLNRHFHHLNDPSLKAEEDHLIQSFFQGTMTAAQAYAKLEELVQKSV